MSDDEWAFVAPTNEQERAQVEKLAAKVQGLYRRGLGDVSQPGAVFPCAAPRQDAFDAQLVLRTAPGGPIPTLLRYTQVQEVTGPALR